MQALLGGARGGLKVDQRHGNIHTNLDAVALLQISWHAPGLEQPGVRHAAHRRQPTPDKVPLRVMVLRLFDGVVNPRGVDAGGARLHLHLAPMDAGLVVQKLPRQPQAYLAPMQPQRVGRYRHQHGPHPKVDPASLAQHHHARVHHGPTGAPGHQGLKVRTVPAWLTQAVVAPVHVAPFQLGLALQLLDEVAMPEQSARKSTQTTLVVTTLGGQSQRLSARSLHHLAQAQAAVSQVRREPRAGAGGRQRRGDATPVLGRPVFQKTLEYCQARASATRLAVGRLVASEPQRLRAWRGLVHPPLHWHRDKLQFAQRRGGPARGVGVRLPVGLPQVAVFEAANHPKLGVFTPRYTVFPAPPGYSQVALERDVVARFFVRMQGCDRCGCVQLGQQGSDLAAHNMHLPAVVAHFAVQVTQAFQYELVMLVADVGLRPNAGLDGIQAQHRATGRRMVQGRVVMQAKVAFEPDHLQVHRLKVPLNRVLSEVG